MFINIISSLVLRLYTSAKLGDLLSFIPRAKKTFSRLSMPQVDVDGFIHGVFPAHFSRQIPGSKGMSAKRQRVTLPIEKGMGSGKWVVGSEHSGSNWLGPYTKRDLTIIHHEKRNTNPSNTGIKPKSFISTLLAKIQTPPTTPFSCTSLFAISSTRMAFPLLILSSSSFFDTLHLAE